MEEIFRLINDNCHALGAEYNKTKKYAAKYADIITQSFHPVKNITTGEGGAVITNDKKISSQLTIDVKNIINKTNRFSLRFICTGIIFFYLILLF